MALKSTELRIGNIIFDHKGELKTVTAFDLINLECLEKNLHCDPRCKDWRGIPLDEDWVKKFGWNNDGYDPLWLTLDRYSQTQWNTYLMGKHGEKHGNIRLIEFVHELQNLYFWITGNELEIKL